MSLIDRGQVMNDYLANLGRKDSYKAKYEALVKAVDDAPTIDAEPVRRGCEWCNGEYHIELSAHAVHYHTSDKSSVYVLDVNFCPNCGAKMRGGEDAG